MRENLARELIAAARELRGAVAGLKFPPPVTHIYNPLEYAWAAHEAYLRKFGGSRRRVLFLGMNPGPFGMAQTGVPFGEVTAVRDWLKISAPIRKPQREHPRRPVQGFDCARSEVSGARLWGLFALRFKRPERFFDQHFVANYCPLAFLEKTGRNLTPDTLGRQQSAKLFAACDVHLRRVVETLQPEWVLGVGAFACRRAAVVLAGTPVRIGQLLHPSPASPAANRDWAGQATRQLELLGVW